MATGTVTGLYYGCPVEIAVDDPDLPPLVPATYVGWAGGPEVMVKLPGTDALVMVPRGWIRKVASAAA